MRPSLSRLTALLVIGLAFVAGPGVVVSRVGGRDGAARMTRGGFHRLGSSDAALHVGDDHDPDSTPAGDVVEAVRQLQHAPPGPPGAAVAVPPPASSFVLLAVRPVVPFHPAAPRTRPAGRAPPLL
jgi:hypothetical protein